MSAVEVSDILTDSNEHERGHAHQPDFFSVSDAKNRFRWKLLGIIDDPGGISFPLSEARARQHHVGMLPRFTKLSLCRGCLLRPALTAERLQQTEQ